jgi:general L-amino acid transport system permease protein
MLPESRRSAGTAGSSKLTWSLNQPRVRSIVYQALLVTAVGLAAWYFVSNAMENLMVRRIASGFGFLSREAGFEIGETTLLSYNAGDTYLRALAVGLLNTFRVATLAIIFSTTLGALIGLARLSLNWLLAKLAAGYIEVIRNVPLVVQLFFWYAVITESLPAPADALNPLPGLFLSNRGFAFPILRSVVPIEMDSPQLSGFNFAGGGLLSPEFAALFLGLTLYTAAFIAEIVRAGILAVDRGQFEAAYSVGLKQRQVMSFVILPQALRIIVPPMTSQYLNCTKNSSLAVAIGYPDLVSIANTTINQTGQAIEGIAIIMLVYLTISLAISGFMNWYNRRFALRGSRL